MKLGKLLLTALLGLSISLNALDFNDKKINNELYLASLNNVSKEIKSYGDGAIIWYLDKYKNKELEKYINDEFELDDLKIKAEKELFTKIKEMNDKYLGKEFTLTAKTTFDDYNFQEQYFPLKMAKKDSYYTFEVYNKALEKIMIFFENPNQNIEKIPMMKAEAKKFIKAKKNSSGYVDRELTAKYTLNIKSLNPDTEYSNYIQIKDCKIEKSSRGRYVSDCYQNQLDVLTTIVKVDIYDGNKLLHTIKY